MKTKTLGLLACIGILAGCGGDDTGIMTPEVYQDAEAACESNEGIKYLVLDENRYSFTTLHVVVCGNNSRFMLKNYGPENAKLVKHVDKYAR